MFRSLAPLLCLTHLPLLAAVQLLPSLPNGAAATALRLDPAGNIYVAGSFAPASLLDSSDAFVAKLSPDGTKLLYFTALAGTQTDTAAGLALGPDGSAFIAGNTNSSDFPVTAGALQPAYVGGGQNQGFLAKVDPAGAVAYSTFLNGPVSMRLTGIALDRDGSVFLTGLGGPNYSLNALTAGRSPQGFLLKLDPALSKVLLTVDGYGGGLLALDGASNIYIAGSAQPDITFSPVQRLTLPGFPAGAFQSAHDARFCLTLGSGPGGPGGSLPCLYQYVARLDPAGRPLWATYVTGTYGAVVSGIAVDRAGNVIVAGTTNSDDYPVTPRAFQTAYAAAAPPFPVPLGSTYSDPPPATGYVTKINATGTGLLWSTYFGGSHSDRITGLAIAPTGEVIVSGLAASSDLPAMAGTPAACRPSAGQELGFIVRLAADGAAAGPAQLVAGAPHCLYLSCPLFTGYPEPFSWPLALRPDGTAVVAGTNGTVASVDFAFPNRLACLADPADNAQLRAVAPGQLLSIFGADLAPAAPFTPPAGVAPSTADFGVFFNGIAAPFLYTSAQQINVQVPYEIAGQPTVRLQVTGKQLPQPLSETLTLDVVERQPAVFLSPAAWTSPFHGYSVCGGAVAIGEAALALNADGTVNDCATPAPAGSTVTLFLDGLGRTAPALVTGAIASAPPTALLPGMDLSDPYLVPLTAATATLPGSVTAVAQVQVATRRLSQLPAGAGPIVPFAMTPAVAGKGLRERLVLIWIRQD